MEQGIFYTKGGDVWMPGKMKEISIINKKEAQKEVKAYV
jgi:hypothetical protein